MEFSPAEYLTVKIPKYDVLGKALREDRIRPDAPVVFQEGFRPAPLLPQDIIGHGIRGYCIPGYGNGQQIWMRDNDRDLYRVWVHENTHINMRLYGGDNRGGPEHEWEVRMLENWRLGYEGESRWYN